MDLQVLQSFAVALAIGGRIGLERVRTDRVLELIIATSPSTEGEATAMFLARVLQGQPVRVSRIARGIVGEEDRIAVAQLAPSP